MVWVVMILKSMFRSITPSPKSLDGTIALATDYEAFDGSKITLVKPKETLLDMKNLGLDQLVQKWVKKNLWKMICVNKFRYK